jgi:hypothetical protein
MTPGVSTVTDTRRTNPRDKVTFVDKVLDPFEHGGTGRTKVVGRRSERVYLKLGELRVRKVVEELIEPCAQDDAALRMGDEDDAFQTGVANSTTEDPVTVSDVVGRPQQIALNQTLDQVEPDALGAVVNASDRSMKELFETVDD